MKNITSKILLKKGRKDLKENYRPIGTNFPKYQCGFWKHFITQNVFRQFQKNVLTKEKFALFYKQVSQRHLIISTMIYSQPN